MDPTELFESEAFAVHGNLFWPDFWQKEWLNADFYKKLGLDVPWQVDSNFQSTESGQVRSDLSSCNVALGVACQVHFMDN